METSCILEGKRQEGLESLGKLESLTQKELFHNIQEMPLMLKANINSQLKKAIHLIQSHQFSPLGISPCRRLSLGFPRSSLMWKVKKLLTLTQCDNLDTNVDSSLPFSEWEKEEQGESQGRAVSGYGLKYQTKAVDAAQEELHFCLFVGLKDGRRDVKEDLRTGLRLLLETSFFMISAAVLNLLPGSHCTFSWSGKSFRDLFPRVPSCRAFNFNLSMKLPPMLLLSL